MHISQVKPGDTLIADDGFSCLDPDQRVTVHSDDCGLFVPCRCGQHYLDGQLNAVGDLVGLYPPVEFKTIQTGAST
ncbi:hypothetical protein Hden_1182 [Hyphomicrobium denitrificans ATCC 51888]|uniref:Uncharacterized protein n=1 Tax=Hyphomicrobium denitrificans (strain ATCC 51888 / DSM 1869 / NCIMB 11706 / TK 0415) TaxID=582899 RepID=D8JVV6_HYPDA|nr:hypothetical protein [Hyphomicrobium denitrificans]ADJ22995.1 hypothetical protein Hden_1182 [Hyphomicrobium denitrificans ATCC 51888]